MAEIVAHYYESRIVDGVGAGGEWSHQLREGHPDEIGNIEYRNLQRLVPVGESDVDAAPVGYRYELETASGWTTHVSRSDVRGSDADVRNVTPLVPIAEDVGAGPDPEPIRKRGGAEYYVESEVDDPWYYRVQPMADEAERIRDGGRVEEVRMYDVWSLDRVGHLEPVEYVDTPFSDSI